MRGEIGRSLDKLFEEDHKKASATPKNWRKVFEKEIDLFSRELKEYLQRGDEVKFVMYSNGNNIGVFKDYITAVSKGSSGCNGLPFIVLPIWEDVKEAIRYRNYFTPNEKPLNPNEVEEDLQKAS